ncbi:hypothetical protein IJG72_04240 [bacterium]|nr:hypothetical protein [bacterium]
MKVSSISNPIQNNYVNSKNTHNENQNSKYNAYTENKTINKNANSDSVNFCGITDLVGKGYNKIAPYCEKFVNWKPLKNRIESGNFVLDIATLGSVLTSSIYAYKYATNKEKSLNERIALSLNCMLVCALGAVTTYGAKSLFKSAQAQSAENYFKRKAEQVGAQADLNKLMDKCGNKFKDVIKALGLKELPEHLKNEVSTENLAKLKEIIPSYKGFSPLADLFSWALINRLAIPVIVQKPATNIAMKICHKFDDNSKAGSENNTKIAQQNNDNKSLTAQENTAKA